MCQLFYDKNLWKERFDILLRIDLVDICSFLERAHETDFYRYCYSRYFSPSGFEEKVVTETLKEINEKGKLLWVLDGFDELELLLQSNSKIAKEIQRLIFLNGEKRLLKNILITSRPGINLFIFLFLFLFLFLLFLFLFYYFIILFIFIFYFLIEYFYFIFKYFYFYFIYFLLFNIFDIYL